MIDLELPLLLEVAAEQPGTELYAEQYSISATRWTPAGLSRSLTVTCGVGVRVLRHGGGGFASTSACTAAGLRTACRSALDAQRLSPNAAWRFPGEYGEPPDSLDLISPGIAAFNSDAEAAVLSEIEDEVRSVGGRLRSASIEAGHRAVMIAAPPGVGRAFAAAYLSAQVTAEVAGPDGRTAGTVLWHGRNPSALLPADLARQCVAQATARSAPPISAANAGKVTVVLAPHVAAKTLLSLAPLFASAASHTERPHGSKAVMVTDDPLCSTEVGSAPFDAEGVTTRRKTLIDHGEPGEPLADASSAARSGRGQPGNAVRADYTQVPAPGPTVLILEPGTCAPAGLLEGVGSGLLAEHLTGSPRLDRRFGTIVLPVAGRFIRAGVPAEPVTGTIIGGLAGRFLSYVTGVAKDLSFSGPAGAPSVRFEGLRVSSSIVAPPGR